MTSSIPFIRTSLSATSLWLLMLFIHPICYGQTPKGIVQGQILSADSLPAPHVAVGVKGQPWGTTTNEQGNFSLHLPAGNITLVIQSIGNETQEKEIEVKAGETITIESFRLKQTTKELQEVVIAGNTNRFAQKESNYIARLPLKNLENPQAYQVITKELLKEQVVVQFDDALKNAPGITKLWTSTGRSGDGAAYFSLRGFSVQPRMINGMAGLTNGGLDPANMEKIEVIKGPSGTLFGSSLVSFGGLINIVTKKPYETFGGEVNYTGGSFGLSRITADINSPINKEKTALVRVNAAYHTEGSFQDVGRRWSVFLAPSFTFKANERLTFHLNTEYYTSEGTNPLSVFLNRSRKLYANTPEQLNFNFNRAYTSNDLTIRNPTFNVFAQASYKLSRQWTSQTNISQSTRRSDGYYSYIMYLEPSNDTLISRFISDQQAITNTTNVQQNFIGDFTIGRFRNRLVAGVDFMNVETNNNSSAFILFDKVNTTRGNDPRYGQMTQQAVDSKLAANTNPTRTTATNQVVGAYISDVFNVTDQLLFMASLRVDYFKNVGTLNQSTDTRTGYYEQLALSPKFGAVYQIVKEKVALYTNYMNGFQNVAPVVQPLADISGTLKPQQANQWEAGVKLDLFNRKLSLTTGYYSIDVSQMTRSESLIRDSIAYNITVQDGTQRSSGFEFEAIANPIAGLNIVGGYSYNDSKMIRSAANVEGRRPVTAGPAHLANVWLSYAIPSGILKGLGVGFGGNYASENKITNNSTTGEFTLPAYTVLNASIFYDRPVYRLALKMNNITDRVYYVGWTTIERQMPAQILASVAVKF